MIREFGSPTFFLTFSCAEYESQDMTKFLFEVNDAPPSYNIGKLCTEDPVSVSRKFSLKFHAFFQTVISKGQILGKVSHFYWKKEYQSRGAPHYHALVWIEDAPVIGVDPPEKVLAWIDDRISCQIPDDQLSPELHQLVTRFQLHKCSNYCKRRRRCGKTFITRCRFGFPRPACEASTLNDVQDSLKSRQRIYHLKRKHSEERVNDYNPLILLLWKANVDLQYVAEKSLALAHYVSTYVTKAAKSQMQDIWQEVSENQSVYSRLWSFGIRSLRSRECGMYEASDLLLGDHLTEKSDAVYWVDTRQPHKRTRRIRDFKVLKSLVDNDPKSNDIYEPSLLNTFYPGRPNELEDVCLYDFVSKFNWSGKDNQGLRQYKKLNKLRTISHKLFDPDNADQRQDYFYSLLLLFVPFREESALLSDNETPEEGFKRLAASSESCSPHHERLKVALHAQSTVLELNEARQADQEEKCMEIDEPQVHGEACTAMVDIHTINEPPADPLSVDERISMLNSDQRRIFTRVRDHLLHQQQHELAKCHCDFKPLCMFVSGVGGTGKSFLIETIKGFVNSTWSSEDVTCAVAAPTGLPPSMWKASLYIACSSFPLSTKGRWLDIGHSQRVHRR